MINNQINILDTGAQFGMGTARIFNAWTNKTVTLPRGLNDFYKAIDLADLVLFGGGSDIHPSLYGHRVNGSYVNGTHPSPRDIMEREMFEACVAKKKPILGICRGAQLACALSGGWLLQDVRGHAGRDHDLILADGTRVEMSSVHHQMMVPFKTKHEMIGWTENITAGHVKWDEKTTGQSPDGLYSGEFYKKEPEIVFFPLTNALAIQGHPEFMESNSPAVALTRKLVQQYLKVSNEAVQV